MLCMQLEAASKSPSAQLACQEQEQPARLTRLGVGSAISCVFALPLYMNPLYMNPF
jgi:hypothetical protein